MQLNCNMENHSSNKWIYLFISVSLLVVCSAYFWYISQKSGNILGYWGWFSIAWIFSLVAAGVWFLCRVLNFVRRNNFSYIFVSVVSFSLSLFGITKVEDMKHLVSIWGILLFSGLFVSSLMLADTYIIELFTAKKRNAKNEMD